MIRSVWSIIVGFYLVLAPALLAQAPKIHRVGFLSPRTFGSETTPGKLAEEITQYLSQKGFAVGGNLAFERREAEGRLERLPALVADLVAAKVDVIVAFGYPVAAAAKQGTSSVPVGIFNTGDPARMNLVASLNRPGANITGVSDVAGELAPKRLELLQQAAPQLHRVAMLWNAGDLGMTARYEASAEAAKALNITVQPLGVREPNDFEDAFAAMEREAPDGLLMVADALTALNRQRVFDFAAKHRLPAIYEMDNFARDGGLMSYGPDGAETAERGADIIARILKGEKPENLPLEQPIHFKLVVNLKAAQSIGLTIPQSVLLRADEVIE